MLDNNESRFSQNDVEDLFTSNPGPLRPKKAIDILQSHLIAGYEAAIDQGVRPQEAVISVLDWATTELQRIDFGGSREPAYR